MATDKAGEQSTESLWSALSKLESQIVRNPGLPQAYRDILKSAIEELRAIEASTAEQSPEPVDLWALVEQSAKLLEWCPVCSIGSSGYIRQENLRRTLKKFGKDGSLNQAVGVEADLKHPGNDTGGEIAELIDRITPENQHIPEQSPEDKAYCEQDCPTCNKSRAESVGESPAPCKHECGDEAAPPEPATDAETKKELELLAYCGHRTELVDGAWSVSFDESCEKCSAWWYDITRAHKLGASAAQAKVSTLEQALRTINEFCSGEAATHGWPLDYSVTMQRVKISDICGAALSGESRQ